MESDTRIWMPVGPIPRSVRHWLAWKLIGDHAVVMNAYLRQQEGGGVTIEAIRPGGTLHLRHVVVVPHEETYQDDPWEDRHDIR